MLSFPVRQIHFSAWLLVVLSAILQVIIFPLPGIYALSWFALAPLIVALLRARPAGELEIRWFRTASPCDSRPGILAGLRLRNPLVCGHLLLDLRYDAPVRGAKRSCGSARPFSLLLLSRPVSRFFRPARGSPREFSSRFPAALGGGTIFVGRGGIGAHRITGFPWLLLGISQVDNIALSRIAASTGVYGISFEIVLVNVAVAAAFLVPREKRGALLAAALAAAAVLQAGRLIDAPPSQADRTALLVQQNIPVSVDWTPSISTANSE